MVVTGERIPSYLTEPDRRPVLLFPTLTRNPPVYLGPSLRVITTYEEPVVSDIQDTIGSCIIK